MTAETKKRHRFQDLPPEDYRLPDLNPYLRIHREMGPPVILGGAAPSYRGRWAAAFDDREAPLHVEIGPGNGFYLAGMAARTSDGNLLFNVGCGVISGRIWSPAKRTPSMAIVNSSGACPGVW